MSRSLSPLKTPATMSSLSHDVSGVEVVVPASADCVSATSRRLIGALHRRVWQRGVTGQSKVDTTALISRPSSLACDVDLTATALLDWSQRCERRGAIAARRQLQMPTTVRVRDWSELEKAMLVDGYVVPACLVDIAVAAVAFADRLRTGEPALVIVHPEPATPDQAALWADAERITGDRLGIDRGVLEFRSERAHVRVENAAA